MHPILAHPKRLGLYLLAWVPVAAFLALLLTTTTGLDLVSAGLQALLASGCYAFVCLAAWYTCRGLPPSEASFPKLVGVHVGSAGIAAGAWFVLGLMWAAFLERTMQRAPLAEIWTEAMPLVLSFGVLLFLFSVVVHQHLVTIEDAAERERLVVELDMLAKQAELKTLKAQVNPHFLFNALNSLSALTGEEPQRAREMALQLAAFFRAVIAAGKVAEHTLEEELALVGDYLAIEQVRFDERLRVDRDLAAEALACRLPALLLQPLVENAIVHGIAQLVDGGTIELHASRRDGALFLSVANPVDPEAASQRGEGIGLANVRRRVEASCPDGGRVHAVSEKTSFRVELTIPQAP